MVDARSCRAGAPRRCTFSSAQNASLQASQAQGAAEQGRREAMMPLRVGWQAGSSKACELAARRLRALLAPPSATRSCPPEEMHLLHALGTSPVVVMVIKVKRASKAAPGTLRSLMQTPGSGGSTRRCARRGLLLPTRAAGTSTATSRSSSPHSPLPPPPRSPHRRTAPRNASQRPTHSKDGLQQDPLARGRQKLPDPPRSLQ